MLDLRESLISSSVRLRALRALIISFSVLSGISTEIIFGILLRIEVFLILSFMNLYIVYQPFR